MSSITWTPAAVSSEARDWRGWVWRIVEAQHVAATMKIVDDAAEQEVLESLLEGSKPAVPDAASGLDYLLATPFRYPPLAHGSRFRAATDPGVFYGAATVRTAGAELGYWRWRFLQDAEDLERIGPVAHTAFRTEICTATVDLRDEPFRTDAAAWTHPSDYAATQSFARVARDAGVGAVIYRSVRAAEPSWCLAVLTPTAFASRRPHPATQSWWLLVNRQGVIWRRDRELIALTMPRPVPTP
ncbi:MAG: RES domain protein [Candidatus Accumulibacter adjunctus]|uniref:RES domain protein n=1 Tax=Candidatus Accumulibacter adjunctus TaxID=1454001 RepID=A0A011NHY0_9PROT|nr:MAG: RES domain protein [Candidatus Accumulibacter adjunctus]